MRTENIAVILAALALLIGLSLYTHSRGQSQNQRSDLTVKGAFALTSPDTAAETTASDLRSAAARNAALQNELDWIFGGKHQRGWFLYTSLIAQTLGTGKGPGSTDFAKAVTAWQKKSGLNVTGVLDEDSFMKMVSEWQNNRLKDRTPAQPAQLITAPVADFYDPQRLPELRQVERNTYAAYKELVAAAIADRSLHLGHSNRSELTAAEKYMKIISAFRSREYQDKLRRESPNSGSAGLAVNSPHFTGRALDVYVGGDPVDTKYSNRAFQVNTPLYKWLVKNAGRFGFRPYFYEPWHWEYVK
jgi:D-alanyl-D-alanine carboxypeptidase